MDDYLHLSRQPEPIGPFNQEEREVAQDLLDAGYRPIELKGFIQLPGHPPSITSQEVWNAMRAIMAGQ